MQDRWAGEIDKITHDFNQSFGALTIDELNWRPNQSTWSIGQNIDHLIVINGSYYPVINALKSGAYKLPFMARFDFMVSFFGKTVLKSVQPDRKRRMKTFPIWEPAKSDIDLSIWEKFEKQQADLKTLIHSSLDLLDNNAIISSPANRNIVYKLETAFDIIVTHERRHFEQSKEIQRIRQT